MLLQLAADLVREQIDHRIKILGFFLSDHRHAPGFDGNFAVLPIFVNRENQMSLASPFEQSAKVREFSFRSALRTLRMVARPRLPRFSILLFTFSSPAPRHPICLRFADGGIPIACRYLATVRRAILICFARSISAIA